ncbi:MAG: Lrp/AsnC ligand binding domain-containing protein [Candidatus Nitrosotenuis sp.]
MSTAYFLINTKLNHETEIIQKIKSVLKHADISSYEIQGVFGVYDIVVKISASTDDKLRKIVLEKLRKIDHIESAITMMINEEQEILCK